MNAFDEVKSVAMLVNCTNCVFSLSLHPTKRIVYKRRFRYRANDSAFNSNNKLGIIDEELYIKLKGLANKGVVFEPVVIDMLFDKLEGDERDPKKRDIIRQHRLTSVIKYKKWRT